ncbi:MAG TPA: beta-galactosidase [Myxococcota bacterium]|nr:beta-galactosidase [Myxococcota bacterium]HOC99024.1 beta-galactosidase [Myxococcota bacterium]HOH76255.1 beta-galactosidase [Myxococcota bacterium]
MSSFEYRDGRFFKDGEPFYFVGAEYQYYRDKRSNWASRIEKLKEGGINVICFYMPWRHHIVHDPVDGTISYDFDGRTLDSRDLRTFIRLCQEKGLHMLAKPGPFVHSELNIGGLPDVASPSFNPEIEPVRVWDGRPLFWEYDNTQLPSPYDPTFDGLAKTWLEQVGAVIEPFCAPKGNIIALQLLDETIYCTSNDAPWHFAYDAPDMQAYHRFLESRYGDISRYNAIHGTEYKAYCFVPAFKLEPAVPVARTRRDLLKVIDWGEFQWRIRRDIYARYQDYLGIDRLPYLTNYAGITPPIVENVPDAAEGATKDTPPEMVKLYPDWWFSQNRVDQDLDVYEYGMISWLGVAAYNIQDASSEPGELGRNEVFNRYINTARRRRGINIEENWGFAKLYHPLSEFPMIPFFQTLACVAGGCTGYVVFCGVNHGYWLDDLDRTTQKQFRTFPSHAPIGENGETGPMYDAMKLLNDWFVREGADFLKAEMDMDVCLLIVPEYAAVSAWVPDRRSWALDHSIPRAGYGVIEEATVICNENGVNYELAELPALTVAQMLSKKRVAVFLSFFMDRAEQEKLVEFARSGGTLICSGELPEYDGHMEPCTLLKDFIQSGSSGVHYSTGNIFNDQSAFLGNLRVTGWQPSLKCSPGLRAFVYRNGDDHFVFFFNFDRDGTHKKFIEFNGMKLDLSVGSKTCGIVRVTDRVIRSILVKGVNEFEKVTSKVRVKLEHSRRASGIDEWEFDGDGSRYDLHRH